MDDVTQTPVKSTSGASLDEQVAQSLYAQRERVYPREVHGLFATMRVLAVVVRGAVVWRAGR